MKIRPVVIKRKLLTDKHTDKRRVKHNFLGAGKYRHREKDRCKLTVDLSLTYPADDNRISYTNRR